MTAATAGEGFGGSGRTRDVAGRRFAVLGLARSGISVARLLARRGAKVVGLDVKPREQLPPEIRDLERAGVRLVLGPHPVDELRSADYVVVSPGIPALAEVAAAEAAGVPVVSEVEVSLWWLRAPVVAVTGTNGKSTVTTLIGELVRRTGRPVLAGANLGTPLAEAVDGPADTPEGLIVAELSSFQLERTSSLHARIALLLNITEDHLDRHGSFDAYVAAKGRVFQNQTPDDFAIVPAGDARCEQLASASPARTLRFGAAGTEAFAEGTDLVVRVPGTDELRLPRSLLRIHGTHNVNNALASLLAARLLEVPPATMAETLAAFTGLPHRMQFVGEVGGVEFYNDSKATNVGAALRAIEGLERSAVLIAGGREKGGSYAPLRDAIRKKIVRMVLIGEARQAMRAELGDLVPCEEAETLEDAVRRAASVAQPGQAVLLAPACSSLDMFRDYVERGERFAAAVRELARNAEPRVRHEQ